MAGLALATVVVGPDTPDAVVCAVLMGVAVVAFIAMPTELIGRLKVLAGLRAVRLMVVADVVVRTAVRVVALVAALVVPLDVIVGCSGAPCALVVDKLISGPLLTRSFRTRHCFVIILVCIITCTFGLGPGPGPNGTGPHGFFFYLFFNLSGSKNFMLPTSPCSIGD